MTENIDFEIGENFQEPRDPEAVLAERQYREYLDSQEDLTPVNANEPSAKLRDNLDMLSEKDRSFANDLLSRLHRSNHLSTKQWYWVNELADRATVGPSPQKVEDLGVDFKRIHEMLTTAKTHLKWPKIKIEKDGYRLVLKIAGPRSKYHGKVIATDDRPFGSNSWYGSIDEEGRWTMPRTEVPEAIKHLLEGLAKDPAKTASVYGQEYGNCCFCRKELTDNRSIDVGYGPTCASHFGLPWG